MNERSYIRAMSSLEIKRELGICIETRHAKDSRSREKRDGGLRQNDQLMYTVGH